MKKFNPLNVSSKFAICGLPLRVDTYRTCSFGCKYCFANYRISRKADDFQIADIDYVDMKLKKILVDGIVNPETFSDVLIANDYTWHLGGMSDPFQPAEKKFNVTRDLIEVSKKYNRHILISTKADTLYDCKPIPELHTFHLSVTNCNDNKDYEPNISSFENRLKFYKDLKNNEFKVGIRVQPFIPNVTTDEIIEYFKDADNFTIEGIKLVTNNTEQKEMICEMLGMSTKEDFVSLGLMNLKPEYRLKLYKPFIEKLEHYHIPYSIADNDLHYIGTNRYCCCGDRLVDKPLMFNNTAMLKKYGKNYTLNDINDNLGCFECCKCWRLFNSCRREEGLRTVKEYYKSRFNRESSPFSPKFQYYSKDLTLYPKYGIMEENK